MSDSYLDFFLKPLGSDPLTIGSSNPINMSGQSSMPSSTIPVLETPELSLTDQILGKDNKFGNLAAGLGGLAQSWLAFQNYNLAKDQFAFQKDSFMNNYGMQVKDYNRQLEERQRARLQGRDPSTTNYLSVADQMAKYGATNPYKKGG